MPVKNRKFVLVMNQESIFSIWIFALGIYYLFQIYNEVISTPALIGNMGYLIIALRILGVICILNVKKPKVCGVGALMIALAIFISQSNIIFFAPQDPIQFYLLVGIFIWKFFNPKPVPDNSFYFLISLAIVYSHFSAGMTKIIAGDPSWINGKALSNILETSSWVRKDIASYVIEHVPASFFILATWASLTAEAISPLLLVRIRSVRLIILVLLSLMHALSLVFFPIPVVNLGVLLALFPLYLKE